MKNQEHELLDWYFNHAKSFLETHSKERIAGLENDIDRLRKLLDMPETITVCFLGNSGIGKSTLLNALAADAEQVLPAGGIGPLTAQATEVVYSDVKTFKVTYQPRGHLWKVAFALESKLTHQEKAKNKSMKNAAIQAEESDFHQEVDEAAKKELIEQIEQGSTAEEGGPPHDTIEGFIKQTKQIVTGNQFSDKPLPYLVDALRMACDIKPRWHSTLEPDDQARIDRVKELINIKPSRSKKTYERSEADDKREFMEDLKAHAAGYLSPLIETIQVGWPADVLKAGVVLVDLPGVGIAQDAYRQVTSRYVREKARAVIVVVDRAGPTESTVELLRNSGYWDRLVGATDDPSSDPCTMLITVTKVDDVATEEWRNSPSGPDRPKKREVFARLVEEFRPRMHSQIREQLGLIGGSENETVNRAREQARNNILDTLEIHPISAPEYRKILMDDEDDRPFLSDVEQTGIPQLRASLVALSEKEQASLRRRIDEVRERLTQNLLNELSIIGSQWKDRTRAAEEAEKLAAALEAFLAPKKSEYDLRVGSFREFLEETVQASIRELVLEARSVAETEVSRYLYNLQGAHWATLRAAVRRGGTFYGSRNIDLPEDIANYFQEPMAAVWGQKLLRNIRKRTGHLSSDIATMVQEICVWANDHGGTQVNRALLENQQKRISNQAAQMNQVGKEAVDELRDLVKQRLKQAIRSPIEEACTRFVRNGNDIGPGVKHRILELFNSLAKQATNAAREPAIAILQTNYKVVREEIQSTFKQWGDPLEDTANLIVERHEERVKRSDAQKRSSVLAELEALMDACPVAEKMSSEPA